MAVLFAVLAWQLSSGPVSVSILNRMIEDAARPVLQGGELAIGDTILIWSAEERGLALRLSDVRLHGADGNEIASVPQLAFDLSVPALFRGMLAPTAVDLYGVEATVLRRPGTGVTLALAEEGAEEEGGAAVIGPLLEALLDEDDRSTPLGYLAEFGIKEARLTFIDEVNGVTFEAPSANLSIYRGDGGVAGLLNADVALADTTAHLSMKGLLRAGEDAARIDMEASDVVPAALARLSPAFADYAVFDAPLYAEGQMEIARSGDLRSARLQLSSGAGNIHLPEPWETVIPLEKAEGLVTIDGTARVIRVEDLSFKAGPHDASLSGTIGYEIGDGLNIARAKVDLTAENFHTEVPEFFAGPVNLDRVHLDAALDFDALRADIAELFVGTAGGGIRLSGNVADGERSPAVKVRGTIEPLPLDAFVAIWPFDVARGARVWVGKNLSGGTLTGGSFDIDLPAGMIEDAENHIAIPKENLRFEFTASGQSLHYLGELPPMEDLEARGLVEGNRFDAWVPSAVIRQEGYGDIAVSEGHFYADQLATKGAPGHISFTVAGATADILSVLDREPLTLISNFGLDPRDVGGTGRLKGSISLPLKKDVEMDEVMFSGEAHAENVAIPNIQENLSVTSGRLDLTVDRKGLTAKGPIGINHAAELELEWRENFGEGMRPRSSYRLAGPLDETGRAALGLKLEEFIAGTAHVDATLTGDGRRVNRGKISAGLTDAVARFDDAGWWKPAGEPATVAFDLALMEDGSYRISDFVLAGEGIDTRGSFTLGPEGGLVAADMPVVKLGEHNDFSFRAGPVADAALQMEVKGARFDARGLLSSFLGGSKKEDEAAAGPEREPVILTGEVVADPMRRTMLTADIAEATGHHGTLFGGVSVRLVQVERQLWTMDVAALDNDGAPVALRIGPDGRGARTLSGSANNAGAVLRALDFTRSMRDGALDVSGTYDDTQPGSPLSGTLRIDKFRIVDAPVLANILTLGSLTGISDTMRGDGIFFDRLELPFAFTENRIHVKDARMSGPAIGLTASGQIDRADDLIDMEGTLVPAYTINSFLGQVPVLGPLIVGREGEGVFAITYGVRGNAEDPTVVVNPLSAIAPGFLRRLFEFGSTLPPEESSRSDAAPEAAAGTGAAPENSPAVQN
ncbi:MAG: AsmA-like C-terminal domain-containing protein [Parvibaculum sp.]|nr:AsmA-like C-terminal domain-containing protein [Parvibaculum sp.]